MAALTAYTAAFKVDRRKKGLPQLRELALRIRKDFKSTIGKESQDYARGRGDALAMVAYRIEELADLIEKELQ